ncbi:dihydrodipicolinate synthase family protein [Methylobacterium oryzae CBMB20]
MLGSTGTYAYLTREERRRAVTLAAEVAGGRVPLLVGIGALRTDEGDPTGPDARAAGADAGLLAPVSYTPLTDAEVLAHVEAVAGEGGLPLVLYDNPATTHFRFSPALIGRIARLPGSWPPNARRRSRPPRNPAWQCSGRPSRRVSPSASAATGTPPRP